MPPDVSGMSHNDPEVLSPTRFGVAECVGVSKSPVSGPESPILCPKSPFRAENALITGLAYVGALAAIFHTMGTSLDKFGTPLEASREAFESSGPVEWLPQPTPPPLPPILPGPIWTRLRGVLGIKCSGLW